jgi:excisionase family DNA binding protein
MDTGETLMAQDKRVTLTVAETSKRLGIGLNQTYDALRRGEIPALRVGKRLLVPIAAFEARLASASVPQGRQAKKTAAAR